MKCLKGVLDDIGSYHWIEVCMNGCSIDNCTSTNATIKDAIGPHFDLSILVTDFNLIIEKQIMKKKVNITLRNQYVCHPLNGINLADRNSNDITILKENINQTSQSQSRAR